MDEDTPVEVLDQQIQHMLQAVDHNFAKAIEAAALLQREVARFREGAQATHDAVQPWARFIKVLGGAAQVPPGVSAASLFPF